MQAGFDAAYASPTRCDVWVGHGTYVPTYKADPFGAANTATLQMRPGIAIYGGFVGNERSLAARNVATQVTTISGEIGTTAATDNLGDRRPKGVALRAEHVNLLAATGDESISEPSERR